MARITKTSGLYLLIFFAVAARGAVGDGTDVVINPSLTMKVGIPEPIQTLGQPTAVIPSRASVVLSMATGTQKMKLENQVARAVSAFEDERDRYDIYAVTFSVLSIVLALSAAISGFLRKPVAAGILSLFVAGSTGIAKTLPVTDRANYYRTLYGQAFTLQVEMSLSDNLTVAEYNQRVAQLKTILIYASKLPGIGEVTPVTDDLLKQVSSKPMLRN